MSTRAVVEAGWEGDARAVGGDAVVGSAAVAAAGLAVGADQVRGRAFEGLGRAGACGCGGCYGGCAGVVSG